VRVTIGGGWESLSHDNYGPERLIEIGATQWHRLIALERWARVAEIWQHTDPGNPSDEEDIVRQHDIYRQPDRRADAKWKSVYPF
jgi:hypothetical protein